MERKTKDEKNLKKAKKIDSKTNRKYSSKGQMKRRIKNSKTVTNVKEIGDDGLIYLKSGEVATLIEVKAIDLSLTSNHEKNLFFSMLKALYQVPNLNLKCYKLNEKLNLNANKVSLDKKIEKFQDDEGKKLLLEESRNLIDDLEEKNFTVSSKYFWVLIAKDTAVLNKQLDEIEDITLNIVPRIYIESVTNKLEIYKFLSNLYLTSNSLDELVWSDLPSLVSPMNMSEKTDRMKFDAENEYKRIVEANKGEYIDLYSKTGGIINPLQIRFIPSDDENHDTKETDCPLAKHLGFLEAFFKTAFESITEKELVMLLAIVEKLYNKKGIFKNTSINTLQNMQPEEFPIFSELYEFLPEYKKDVDSKEKEKIIEQLDILLSRFLTGTDSYLFDGHTNIDLSNDLIAFNLQELLYSGNQRLINTQTLNLLTYLNNSIVANKINNDKVKLEDRKHVMIIADEFHLFIDENNFEVLRNFGQLARRIRKYSGSLVVATQSVKDFVGSQSILRHSTAIFNNCQYQMIGMLKEDDLLAYLELFKQNPLTDTQKNFLMSARRGEFLLNIDSKNRLRIWIRATELEREMMGEGDSK